MRSDLPRRSIAGDVDEAAAVLCSCDEAGGGGVKCQRILILCLLSLSVLSPIFFFPDKLASLTDSFGPKEFLDDVSGFAHSKEIETLWSVQEHGEGVKEPLPIVYKDVDVSSVDRMVSNVILKDKNTNDVRVDDVLSERKGINIGDDSGAKIQKIAALNLVPAREKCFAENEIHGKHIIQSWPHLLKLFPLASKLKAMTANTEEQLRAQRNQADYLIQLAARTFPKGLHCLSMRLTADYFALPPEEREFSNRQKLKQADLYHFAIFSDNVLACAVVVNSTVLSSKEPEKTVFHVVTDALNLPAIAMWFLTNPPGKATIEIRSIDDFKPSSANHGSILKQGYSQDPRFKSSLNYLRFYLPELFPQLDKIVLLDHDVVVQKDLRGLWLLNMKGKVVGAVEICGDDEYEFSQRMDELLNFSDPLVSKKFDAKACTWSFGMNIFDLRQWRRHALTDVYHKWLLLGRRRKLWKDGSLPLGLVTFYNHTVALDKRWHLRGLGKDPALGQREAERAAVIHYDGLMKPWLEIGIARYKGYWSKFLSYDLPILQQCNIHP